MKTKGKIILGVCGALIVAGVIAASVKKINGTSVTVQTELVGRRDLASVVTASGEIKPRNYINLGASSIGPIQNILVKEGDHVRKGQVVARIEDTQAKADVAAQKASVQTAYADSGAAEAGEKAMDDAINTAQAGVDKAQTELDRSKLTMDRYDKLLADKLVPRQDYEQKKSDYETAIAGLTEAQTRLAQAKSNQAQSKQQLFSQQRRVTQLQANLVRYTDVLDKYSIIAPLDGVVTNLPVKVGETVVPGVQGSAASTIMTIADMSIITAEVQVDETDIVRLSLNQPVEVTIDAISGKTFAGKVIEIGNTAIVRSTGVAASLSNTSSQEAKDFKVVVALSNPTDEIRPGLTCTAKITTATRSKVITIPLQALTVRQPSELTKQTNTASTKPVSTGSDTGLNQPDIQGVFVVKGDHATFRKVVTGITGAMDIEVVSGIEPGDQIVTGSYQVIRTIRNDARVKVDNKKPDTTAKSV